MRSWKHACRALDGRCELGHALEGQEQRTLQALKGGLVGRRVEEVAALVEKLAVRQQFLRARDHRLQRTMRQQHVDRAETFREIEYAHRLNPAAIQGRDGCLPQEGVKPRFCSSPAIWYCRSSYNSRSPAMSAADAHQGLCDAASPATLVAARNPRRCIMGVAFPHRWSKLGSPRLCPLSESRNRARICESTSIAPRPPFCEQSPATLILLIIPRQRQTPFP